MALLSHFIIIFIEDVPVIKCKSFQFCIRLRNGLIHLITEKLYFFRLVVILILALGLICSTTDYFSCG